MDEYLTRYRSTIESISLHSFASLIQFQDKLTGQGLGQTGLSFLYRYWKVYSQKFLYRLNFPNFFYFEIGKLYHQEINIPGIFRAIPISRNKYPFLACDFIVFYHMQSPSILVSAIPIPREWIRWARYRFIWKFYL